MTCNLHRCTMYVERKAQTTFSGNYRRKKDFSFFYNAEILLMFSFFETEPPIAVTSPAVFFGPWYLLPKWVSLGFSVGAGGALIANEAVRGR